MIKSTSWLSAGLETPSTWKFINNLHLKLWSKEHTVEKERMSCSIWLLIISSCWQKSSAALKIADGCRWWTSESSRRAPGVVDPALSKEITSFIKRLASWAKIASGTLLSTMIVSIRDNARSSANLGSGEHKHRGKQREAYLWLRAVTSGERTFSTPTQLDMIEISLFIPLFGKLQVDWDICDCENTYEIRNKALIVLSEKHSSSDCGSHTATRAPRNCFVDTWCADLAIAPTITFRAGAAIWYFCDRAARRM